MLEYKSLEELQINVDSYHKMKTISKFNFNAMHALNENDTHKMVTMGLSYSVILILLFFCAWCFNIATGSKSLCCAPCNCLISLLKWCTQCFTHIGESLKKRKVWQQLDEIVGILNNSNLRSSETNVTYISTAPEEPEAWTLRKIDDISYLTYDHGGKIYKFNLITQTALSGRERND